MTMKFPQLALTLLCAVCVALMLCTSASSFLPVTPAQLTYASGALICSLSNYGLTGGAEGTTGANFGSAVTAAFAACVTGTTLRKSTTQQAVLVVPPGTFYLTSNVLLKAGTNWFLHFNGSQILYQNVGGYCFIIQNANNFVLSGDVLGSLNAGIRGSLNGQADLYAPFGSNIRLLKLDGGSNMVVGRFNFLQSPAFSFVVSGVTNIEIFQTLVNGQSSHGGTDAMDISGNHIHVHDCQIHGGDECVTMKSPVNDVLVENIYCEGASSEFGSFGEAATANISGNASITNIVYRNIYSLNAAGGFYIKGCTTNNGIVKNVTVSNLIVNNTAYPVGIDFYWECSGLPEGTSGGGNLVVEDVVINGVMGTIADATRRPVIRLSCDKSSKGNFPTCKNISLSNINVWPAGYTTGSSTVYDQCSNAVGSGASCLSATTFTTTANDVSYTVKNQGGAPAPTWGLIQYPLHYYAEATYPPTTAADVTQNSSAATPKTHWYLAAATAFACLHRFAMFFLW